MDRIAMAKTCYSSSCCKNVVDSLLDRMEVIAFGAGLCFTAELLYNVNMSLVDVVVVTQSRAVLPMSVCQ